MKINSKNKFHTTLFIKANDLKENILFENNFKNSNFRQKKINLKYI